MVKTRVRDSVRLEFSKKAHAFIALIFLRDDRCIELKSAVTRAVNAFYAPWAYEGKVPQAELDVIAKRSAEELRYRLFELEQRFPAAASLSLSPLPSASAVAAKPVQHPDPSSDVQNLSSMDHILVDF